MRRLAIGLLAVCAVALVVSITASAAQAQCSNGACGFGARGPGRAVIRTTVRFGGRLGGRVGTRLRSTRLFDGDGRPFRRAG
jgi:hypothetical protein